MKMKLFFEALNISVESEEDDQITIKSSRTGLTVNPNNEFPYQILMHIRRWTESNRIKRTVGLPSDVKFASDIPKAILGIYRLSNMVRPDIINFLTGSSTVTLPCPLSDLVTLKAVANS